MVVAKGKTKRATSSEIFSFCATIIVTGSVAIELEVAKAVNKALDAEEKNRFGFRRVMTLTKTACQSICRNNPNKKIKINNNMPRKLCSKRCCKDASATAVPSKENKPKGVKYIS